MQAQAIAYDVYSALLNVLLRFPSHGLRLSVMRRWGCNQVGHNVVLERGIELHGKGGVTLGAGCTISARTILDGRGGLRIGAGVTISQHVAILTADHDPQTPDFEGRTRGVTIGDNAWIATRSMILPGTEIGEGVVVAAGSVVHGHVPEWTIVAGNPAVRIADRSREAGPPTGLYRRWFH